MSAATVAGVAEEPRGTVMIDIGLDGTLAAVHPRDVLPCGQGHFAPVVPTTSQALDLHLANLWTNGFVGGTIAHGLVRFPPRSVVYVQPDLPPSTSERLTLC